MSRRRNRKQRRLSKHLQKRYEKTQGGKRRDSHDDDHYTTDTRPDWNRKCLVCDATPIVPVSGMCGPCTFGEAETVDGNW